MPVGPRTAGRINRNWGQHMAFQPVLDCAQAIIRAESSGQECLTILNFYNPAGSSGEIALNNLAIQIGTAWIDHALPLFTPDYVATKVETQALNTEVDVTSQYVLPSGAGTRPFEEPMSNNNTIAIQHKTGLSGPWARGRTFWPQLGKSDVNNNEVSILRIAAILSVFNEIKADCAAVGWQHVVVSRWYNKAKRPAGVFFPVLTYAVGDFVVDSQRRRLPKRGR